MHQTNPNASDINEQFPMATLELHGERWYSTVRYEDPTMKKLVELFDCYKVCNAGFAIQRGHRYHVQMTLFATDSAQGHFRITIDGVVIRDYIGPVGYLSAGAAYPQYGIYRHAAPKTIAARFQNMQIR